MLAPLVSLVLSTQLVTAHLSFWHPSQYGFDRDVNYEPYGPGSEFVNWWFHGSMDSPPAEGEFFELPAGGTAVGGEIACKKRFTTWGGQIEEPESACPDDFNSMHELRGELQHGTVIAIAYESDVRAIQPEDMVVISANHTSGFYREVSYQIPADLPECPEGGCHCMWGWIHGKENGGDEINFIGLKCIVTGARPDAPKLAKPRAAIPCKHAPETCIKGAKLPIYWDVERGNLGKGYVNDDDPPFYNLEMGFTDGAQIDIFESTSAGPKPSAAGSPVVASSAPVASTSAPPVAPTSAPSSKTNRRPPPPVANAAPTAPPRPSVSRSSSPRPTSSRSRPTISKSTDRLPLTVNNYVVHPLPTGRRCRRKRTTPNLGRRFWEL